MQNLLKNKRILGNMNAILVYFCIVSIYKAHVMALKTSLKSQKYTNKSFLLRNENLCAAVSFIIVT